MTSGSETGNAARWLALTRAGVTTVLAGSVGGAFLAGHLPFPFAPFLALIALSYLLSGAYLALIPRVRNPAVLAEVQIYADVVLETVLIYLSGGPYSVFPFIYLLSILASSIVVAPRRSFAVATLSVLLHGALLVLQFHRWVPPMLVFESGRDVGIEGSLTILLISGNFCASFTVAYVATQLAGRLRQARGDARRSEATLADLQALHEDIVQSVPSGLLTFDGRGAITTVNRTAETLCRRSETDLRGVGWDTLFETAPAFARVWESLAREGRSRLRFEAGLRRQDGSRIPVGVSVSFLRRGLGVICSFQDLTEIRHMEEQVRHADRLAAIGRFAAGLAHEIRNPIGSIRGSVEVLREGLRVQGDDRRLMDIILRESDRLDGLVRDFLQFSRPPRLVRVPTDLAGMLDEILLMLSHQIETQGPPGLRIVREYGEPTVKALVDPAQMRQALWNLCLNAVEAMPRGGELRVGVREGSRGTGTMEITVRDSGVGIGPEQLPHVFEPFFTTKPHGTGLGLAIVHRVVEDHGGEIRVESDPGAGSRFTIVLHGDET